MIQLTLIGSWVTDFSWQLCGCCNLFAIFLDGDPSGKVLLGCGAIQSEFVSTQAVIVPD